MLNRAITNKYGFSFHLRRFVHSNDKSLDELSTFSLKNSHTHDVSVGDSSSVLSDSDIDKINNLAFCDYTSAPKEANTKEGTLLDEKLANVKNLFGADPENRAFVNYKLPQGLKNPYIDIQLNQLKRKRLSVTQLCTTQNWCELRNFYDFYSQNLSSQLLDLKFQIQKGKKIHKSLEDETHPELNQYNSFVQDFLPLTNLAMDIDSDMNTLLDNWCSSISRLISLFTSGGGHSREIICHGFINIQNGKLVRDLTKDGNTSEESVIISGIIDHLTFRNKRNHQVQKRTTGLDREDQSWDSILAKLLSDLPTLKSNNEIVISDIKTRSVPKMPSIESVVQSSKLQTMYYKYFLSHLSQDMTQTYHSFLINAQRRGLDVDAPIDSTKILTFILTNPLFANDMDHLLDGKPIHFAPFDNDTKKPSTFDMTAFNNLLDQGSTSFTIPTEQEEDDLEPTKCISLQDYKRFYTKWKTPITLKYFAARLSQIYYIVGNLVSNDLMIEYYYHNDNFHNTIFPYDPVKLEKHAHDVAMVWFGHRDMNPIEPVQKKFNLYCKYCDYKHVCSWKNKNELKLADLGKELQKIILDSNQHNLSS
ncbi:Mitochondrial 5'-3' exonuclease and sliding exonuclease [Saccharomyces pastorianus]|uniref:Exonuclease V, mitochondrial n=1 Tax=Saccharomyces pastorianus TaxID=27292 RepID=A0A6C1E4V4_SACPS|nr:Mitochondrial 5'-3' exonuclease and sliding exonuclease [Saccharomyces pastorianus]